MLHVLAQHDVEVAGSVMRQVVEAFPAQGADEASVIAFVWGARTGVRMMRMSAPSNTASNAPVNLLSRSRIKNRNRSARSPRSINEPPYSYRCDLRCRG